MVRSVSFLALWFSNTLIGSFGEPIASGADHIQGTKVTGTIDDNYFDRDGPIRVGERFCQLDQQKNLRAAAKMTFMSKNRPGKSSETAIKTATDDVTTSVQHPTSVAEFDDLIEKAGKKTVILDFAASWCPHCVVMEPVFEALAQKYPHVVFATIDVDELEEVSDKYGVEAVPTFKVLKNGEVVDELVGADADALEALVEKYQGDEAAA